MKLLQTGVYWILHRPMSTCLALLVPVAALGILYLSGCLSSLTENIKRHDLYLELGNGATIAVDDYWGLYTIALDFAEQYITDSCSVASPSDSSGSNLAATRSPAWIQLTDVQMWLYRRDHFLSLSIKRLSLFRRNVERYPSYERFGGEYVNSNATTVIIGADSVFFGGADWNRYIHLDSCIVELSCKYSVGCDSTTAVTGLPRCAESIGQFREQSNIIWFLAQDTVCRNHVRTSQTPSSGR